MKHSEAINISEPLVIYFVHSRSKGLLLSCIEFGAKLMNQNFIAHAHQRFTSTSNNRIFHLSTLTKNTNNLSFKTLLSVSFSEYCISNLLSSTWARSNAMLIEVTHLSKITFGVPSCKYESLVNFNPQIAR